MNKLLLLAALTLLPAAAQAEDVMFGGGLTVGTMVVPGEYPASYPKQVRDNDESQINKVKGDAHLGLEAVYYLDESNRVGFGGALGFGKSFFDSNLILKYNRVINFGAADFVFGGGPGMGRSTFKGGDTERLDVRYYAFRAETGPVFRQDFLAEQVLLYGQWNAPWDQVYTDGQGAEVDASRAAYLMIGIEIQGMFGNFSG